MSLLFCTTNTDKFELGSRSFQKHGLILEQLQIEVDEVQSEDPYYILDHKIRSIYEKVKRPLIVTDDSWNIPALGGFPGAYMKSVNHWLAPDDWLNLMSTHEDKRIFLESRLAYIDESGVKNFEDSQERKFLDKVSETDGVSILRVISLSNDPTPLNELWKRDPELLLNGRLVWENFIDWYKNKK